MREFSLIDFNALLAPFPGNNPAGEDLSFSCEFDQILEARRADESYLSQGEWETPLKSADWKKVIDLTTDILQHKSKDLQVALWLTEALTQIHGFRGLAQGMQFTTQFLENFWGSLYPRIDGESLDERIGKLAWFTTRLPEQICLLPFTQRDKGSYSLAQWREALALDNVGAKDKDAFQKAVNEGKITRETIEKAARLSGSDYYQKLLTDTTASLDALSEFDRVIGDLLGAEVPSTLSLHKELRSASELLTRFASEFDVIKPPAIDSQKYPSEKSDHVTFPTVSHGSIRSRTEALARLREVATFFRQTEPHSPVAYLADKAASWGTLTLDQWLRTVIKDGVVLSQLEEALGVTDYQSGQPGE